MSERRDIPAAGVVTDRGPIGEKRKAVVDLDGIAASYPAPKPATRRLTPHEQRAAEEDRWPDEKQAEVIDSMFGPASLVVKTEADLRAEAAKHMGEFWRTPHSREGDEETPTAKPIAPADAAKLRSDFLAHAKKLQAQAVDAKGNAAAEKRVAESIEASAKVGAELKKRGVL